MSSRTLSWSHTAPASRCCRPSGLAGMLGDRPAVLAGEVGQQPEHEGLGVPSRLHPAEPAGDPAQQLLQPRLPARRGYAVACGHCVLFGCPHTTGSSQLAALVRRPWPLTSKITISGWSTDVERCVNGAVCLVDGAISARVR